MRAISRADFVRQLIEQRRQRPRPLYYGGFRLTTIVTRAAELFAIGLCRRQRLLGPFADHPALLLGERSVDVEHVSVGTEISDDEGNLVLHQTADEVHVTAKPVEFRDDHGRLGLRGGFQCGIDGPVCLFSAGA
jgi:hypothetical protein